MKLPLELWNAVLDEIESAEDLRVLRLCSRDMQGIATPRAFRQLLVTHSTTSADHLSGLIRSKGVAQHVREVVYQHTEIAEDAPAADIDGISGSLAGALALTPLLPLLDTVKLIFRGDSPGNSAPDSPEQGSDAEMWTHEPAAAQSSAPRVQLVLLEAVSSISRALSGRLKTLVIDGLFAIQHKLFEHDSFHALVTGLTHLHISVRSDVATHNVPEFWSSSIRRHFLAHPTSTLTSLSLHSDQTVGLQPRLPFDGLAYSRLQSLSLECIHFNLEVGVEDFIVRHKDTLTSLRLKDCTIALKVEGDESAIGGPRGRDAAERIWSQTWARLADELHKLTELVVTEIRGWQGKPLRYSWRQDGYFWNYCALDLEGDDVGLRGFEGTVANRRKQNVY